MIVMLSKIEVYSFDDLHNPKVINTVNNTEALCSVNGTLMAIPDPIRGKIQIHDLSNGKRSII